MSDLAKDTCSLTDFQHHTAEFLPRLQATGQPLVLTVQGRAALIVQDAGAYQRLLERVDRLEAIEGIRRGLDSLKRGEGRPVAEAFTEVQRSHGVSR